MTRQVAFSLLVIQAVIYTTAYAITGKEAFFWLAVLALLLLVAVPQLGKMLSKSKSRTRITSRELAAWQRELENHKDKYARCLYCHAYCYKDRGDDQTAVWVTATSDEEFCPRSRTGKHRIMEVV